MIEYTWTVYKNNKIIGKIISLSSMLALSMAQEKYGRDGIWLEKCVS